MNEFNISESEIPPKQIFEKMKSNIYTDFSINKISSINKAYIYSRKTLLNILHKITNAMGFKSQTFFLCVHYLDIIYLSNKNINMNINLIGLSSLCLSAKFCENDPNVPHLQYFIKVLNVLLGYKNYLSMNDIKSAEVYVLKLLNYKLNYYTAYDFNSFLFAHGILKLEQLKEIGNNNNKYNNKRYNSKNKNDFFINQVNSIMIKNILEKIYKKSRYYLDIVINKTKLSFKYNTLYISILIMKKSVNEVLEHEQKTYLYDKKAQEEFAQKNSLYFKEIMSDFYNIEYENNEQYQKLVNDDEIKAIFGQKEKIVNEIGIAAPPCIQQIEDRKEDEKENNDYNNNKLNNKNEKKSIFNSSVTNGFYRKLKINIDEDYKKQIDKNDRKTITKRIDKNSMSKSKDKTYDNLDINLNNIESHNSYRKKETIRNKLINTNKSTYNIQLTSKDKNKEKEIEELSNNKLQKKYNNITNLTNINNATNSSNNKKYMSRIEAYNNFKKTNTINNLKISENIFNNNKYNFNKKEDIITEKNSPVKLDETGINLNNNYSNYSRMNKFSKIKGLNNGKERNDYSFSIIENYNNKEINKKSCDKKPYYRKYIYQNNIENSSLNFNSTNNINLITDRKKFESINAESSNRKKNLIINKYYTRINLKFPNKEKNNNTLNTSINLGNESTFQNNNIINDNPNQIITTSTSRYRRKFYNTINKNKTITNDLSTDIKTQDTIFVNNINNNNKNEIESYLQKNTIDNKGLTSFNFYKNTINKISVNTTKNNENKNNEINKSFIGPNKNKITYLLGKQNSQLNNTLKEINIAYAKNKNEEKSEKKENKYVNKDNKNETEKKEKEKEKENSKEINTILSYNDKEKDNIKVNFTKSIRQKYLNNNKNYKSFNNINKNNDSIIEDKNITKEKNENKKENETKEYNAFNTINTNSNNSNVNALFIKNRFSSNNNNNKNDQNLPFIGEKEQTKNNDQNNTKISFYKKTNKDKNLFINNEEEENEENKNGKDKKGNYKRIYRNTNINFYKSQNNFYTLNKTEKNIEEYRNKEEIIKNQQDKKIGNDSYFRNRIYKNKLNKNDLNTKSQKNTTINNDDININTENKNDNITSDHFKYKNIYRKSNVPTPSNMNNSFIKQIKDNNVLLNRKENSNETENKESFVNNINNNISNKYQFYRKTIDKAHKYNSRNIRNYNSIIINKNN